MKLTDLFNRKEFVITSEVGPVKGCVRDLGGLEPPCLKEAQEVKDRVHAVNVTDNQSAVMKLGSLAACVRLKKMGLEPIYQITCRDRNRLALQSEILTAYSLGVDNMLMLTGDHTNLGDHKEAKPVFDLDSVQLIKIAAGLQAGKDMVGNDLLNAPDIYIGAVVNPNFEPLDLQLIKMEKKIEAGAQFFQTQAVYDPDIFEKFIRKTEGFGVPIQYGHVILKSPAMAKYMDRYVSGIKVPKSLIDEINSVSQDQRKQKAIEISARLVKEIAPMVQGVHFMPLGWSDILPEIIEEMKSSTVNSDVSSKISS